METVDLTKLSNNPPDEVIGEWELEFNKPYGFIVRNRKAKQELHFSYMAIGWFTSVLEGTNTTVLCHSGTIGVQPMLVDKESVKIQERVKELQAKNTELTTEEAQELLKLCGIIKGG